MDSFRTRYLLKDGWALLSYKDGENVSLPVYVQKDGSYSFQFEKTGTLEEIELMLPVGDNILVDPPTWGSSWQIEVGTFMYVHPRSIRRPR